MDFGIAHAMNATTGGDRLTATSAVVGTAQYFSPPSRPRGHEVDARTDVYSLGCVLYEMLTGQALFSGDTPRWQWPISTSGSGRSRRPSGTRGISAELDAVVLKALAKKRRTGIRARPPSTAT